MPQRVCRIKGLAWEFRKAALLAVAYVDKSVGQGKFTV